MTFRGRSQLSLDKVGDKVVKSRGKWSHKSKSTFNSINLFGNNGRGGEAANRQLRALQPQAGYLKGCGGTLQRVFAHAFMSVGASIQP